MSIFSKSGQLILLTFCIIFIAGSCKTRSHQLILTTVDVSGISPEGAVSGGYIKAEKGSSVIERGVCWDVSSPPKITGNKTIDGNGAGSFLSTLKGLDPGTVYYVRSYAISSRDTAYGNVVTFSTLNYEIVSDIDGNEYRATTIGTRTWMTMNLKTTKYNDGTHIPLVSGEAAWAGLSTPGYCWYKNEEGSFKESYGALYNWYTVNTGKLCPAGWHVPDDNGWSLLTTYLGGEDIAGGKLKESGKDYWVDPNTGATDERGFSALPGGFRYYDGKFFDFGFSAYWWCAGELSESRACFRFIYYNEISIYRFDNSKKNGFSVRCIKN